MYTRTNICYNERGSRTNYVRSSIPHGILQLTSYRKTRWVSMSCQTFVLRKFKLQKAQRLRTGTSKVFSFGQAADLLRSWVRIPPGAWIFVCYECCVLSGRGLCDELITRPEEFYRLCCVVVCDLETSRIGAPYIYIYIYI